MRRLDISFDFKRVKASQADQEEIKRIGFVSPFEAMLVQAITAVYQSGLPLDKGRVYGRVQRAMDALEVGEHFLPLEETEFEFVKEVFTHPNVRFHPNQYRLITNILENLEKAIIG